MGTTDYPTPWRIVDDRGHSYRVQFLTHGATSAATGQLVAIADGTAEAAPVELTRDGVDRNDVDTEVARWHEWHSVVRSDESGYWVELSIAQVQRRFANAGLQSGTDET